MFEPSPLKLLILVVILLVIFGPARIPQLARSLGRGVRELRDAVSGEDEPPRTTRATEADLVEARQATPAPTPEIAEAEVVDERRGGPAP